MPVTQDEKDIIDVLNVIRSFAGGRPASALPSQPPPKEVVRFLETATLSELRGTLIEVLLAIRSAERAADGGATSRGSAAEDADDATETPDD